MSYFTRELIREEILPLQQELSDLRQIVSSLQLQLLDFRQRKDAEILDLQTHVQHIESNIVPRHVEWLSLHSEVLGKMKDRDDNRVKDTLVFRKPREDPLGIGDQANAKVRTFLTGYDPLRQRTRRKRAKK